MGNFEKEYYLKKINKWRKNVFFELIIKILGSIAYYFTLRLQYEGSIHYKIAENIFTKNRTIIINSERMDIVIDNGYKKIILRKENIRKIVFLKYPVLMNNIFTIDIYDNNLSAYECFDTFEYEKAIEVKNMFEKIFNIAILDKTDQDYYEGYKQRLI